MLAALWREGEEIYICQEGKYQRLYEYEITIVRVTSSPAIFFAKRSKGWAAVQKQADWCASSFS